jgi:hypothetical protein
MIPVAALALLALASADDDDGWRSAEPTRRIPCGIAAHDVANFTVQKFRQEYEGKLPVLIRGGTKAWRAHKLWTQRGLERLLADVSLSYKTESDVAADGPIENDMSRKTCKSKLPGLIKQQLGATYVKELRNSSRSSHPPYVFSAVVLEELLGLPNYSSSRSSLLPLQRVVVVEQALQSATLEQFHTLDTGHPGVRTLQRRFARRAHHSHG